jgi:hypothetical protein
MIKNWTAKNNGIKFPNKYMGKKSQFIVGREDVVARGRNNKPGEER